MGDLDVFDVFDGGEIMIQVIEAPSIERPVYPSVFLAGGITNCYDWQNKVIEQLKNSNTNLSIFNPKRQNFDILDSDETFKQIKWEFDRLETADIFSIYFCNSESVQPICMYELGRNVVRMQNRFPSDWEKHIVVSVEDGYKRADDVRIQLKLCAPKMRIDMNATPDDHAHHILWYFNKL